MFCVILCILGIFWVSSCAVGFSVVFGVSFWCTVVLGLLGLGLGFWDFGLGLVWVLFLLGTLVVWIRQVSFVGVCAVLIFVCCSCLCL